jgi:hypothetical protein
MADVESAKLAIEAAAKAHEAAAQLKLLELLFDYTKFHIGLYLTLTASYIAIATVKVNEKFLVKPQPYWLSLAIIAFIVAGLAGGVIASSITQCQCTSSQQFLNQPIGPWDWKTIHFPARVWTYIEHTSFWVGLLSAAISFFWAGLLSAAISLIRPRKRA